MVMRNTLRHTHKLGGRSATPLGPSFLQRIESSLVTGTFVTDKHSGNPGNPGNQSIEINPDSDEHVRVIVLFVMSRHEGCVSVMLGVYSHSVVVK